MTATAMLGARWTTAVAAVLLLVGLSGCRHRKPQLVVLPQQTPVALEKPPNPAENAEIEAPNAKLPAVPVAEAATKPKRVRRRPKATAAAVPGGTEIAAGQPSVIAENTASEAGSVIGELTPGGEQNPKTRQEAADLIADTDRRLNALPARVQQEQKAQISKVRNFWRDAQQALRSGDAQGAKTLATKAKLLLDDLEKGGAS